jgi:hypothetical protein
MPAASIFPCSLPSITAMLEVHTLPTANSISSPTPLQTHLPNSWKTPPPSRISCASFPSTQPSPRILLPLPLHLLRRPRPPGIRIPRVILRSIMYRLLRPKWRRSRRRRGRDKVRRDIARVLLLCWHLLLLLLRRKRLHRGWVAVGAVPPCLVGEGGLCRWRGGWAGTHGAEGEG